ncbi:MAG: carotenoid biosynthesis protein [Bacteroidota bacterium]
MISKYSNTAKAVIGIVYLVGILGMSIPETRGLFQQLTPVNLLFAGFMLFLFHRPYSLKPALLFLLVFLGGFGVEVAGVQTGLVFGSYAYGEALGLKIAGTPLLIGLNWLMLIYMVYHLLQDLETSFFLKSIIGALMMVAYDLLLEPVAIRLDFWQWGGGAIPLQNYLAWFGISFVFLLIWNLAKAKTTNPVSNTLLATQMSFFLILNLTL